MPRKRGPLDFKQTNAVRAIKAVEAAGIHARIEIDTTRKTITIIPTDEPPKDGGTGKNPWDEVLTNAENKKRVA